MIRRLYAHNFRCLENFDLPIANRASSLLIGKNGSGKSTVGLALEVLQRIARGASKVDELVKPKDLVRGRADVPMRFEIEIEIDGNRYEYVVAFELPPGVRSLRVREESLTVNNQSVYSRELAELHLSRAGDAPSATFRLDWHLVALAIIQEKSSNDPLSVFRHWLARTLILRPVPSLISGKSYRKSLEPEPSVVNFAEWFSGLFAYAPASYSKIDRYLKQVMGDLTQVKNVPGADDSQSLFVEFADGTGRAGIPFEDLSDGEKCLMICSLVLAANEAYGPLTCYWDEPDCYLAPQEVGQLTMALRQAFESEGQLIVTSHNPEAIARFSNENTILLHRRSHMDPVTAHLVDSLKFDGELIDALIRGEIEP